MPTIARESAISFANQLRSARLAALGDAEAFDGIIHAVERLGSYLSKEKLGDKGRPGDLGKYKTKIEELVERSGTAEPPDKYRAILTPFSTLYDLVRDARNDAVHQGAFARHLTRHAIELAIVLEDALSSYVYRATDFMALNPVCAELWQPIGFIRQQMLANSYSYLPVRDADENWHVVSDSAIAIFLGSEGGKGERTKRLASPLRDALFLLKLMPPESKFVDESVLVAEALRRLEKPPLPVLLVRHETDSKILLGILTAFDLL